MCLIESNFYNVTQRIDFFEFLLDFDKNQRIEPSFQKWLNELNFFVLFKELNLFFENDSKNYIFFNMTHRNVT